jgi:hypothetical protein
LDFAMLVAVHGGVHPDPSNKSGHRAEWLAQYWIDHRWYGNPCTLGNAPRDHGGVKKAILWTLRAILRTIRGYDIAKRNEMEFSPSWVKPKGNTGNVIYTARRVHHERGRGGGWSTTLRMGDAGSKAYSSGRKTSSRMSGVLRLSLCQREFRRHSSTAYCQRMVGGKSTDEKRRHRREGRIRPDDATGTEHD